MSDSNNKVQVTSESPKVEGNSQPKPAPLSERVKSLRLPEQSGTMGRRWGWLPWALCGVLLLTTLVFGSQALRRSQAESAKPSDTTKSTADSGDIALESKGYIIPAHRIQVSPKVGGMIVKLNIEEGKFFKEGEILAEIEKVNWKADHDRAVAAQRAANHRLQELTNYRNQEIELAEAEWKEAEVQVDALEKDSRRSVGLRDTKALADRDIEQIDSACEAMKKRAQRLRTAYELMKKGPRDEKIDAAKADVQQAEADLVKAKWNLDNCNVTAPVSGIILTKQAEKGSLVNPVAYSNSISASLCDMADLSDLEVELTIQERDIAQVFKDQKCRISPEAYSKRTYQGYVSRLMPIADRAKGAITVRVKVSVPKEEEGVYLKPDMGVNVAFLKKAGS